jgi:hypothetical protein
LFLYRVGVDSIELVKAFLFAEKDPNHYEEEVKNKMALQPLKKREYVEPEIPGIFHGEYQDNNFYEDGGYVG